MQHHKVALLILHGDFRSNENTWGKVRQFVTDKCQRFNIWLDINMYQQNPIDESTWWNLFKYYTHSILLTTLSLITCDFNYFILLCFVY